MSASRSSSDWSRQLVDALVEAGVITADTAHTALAEAVERGRPVAAVLAQQGAIEPRIALNELSKLSGVTAVDIFEDRPMGEAFKLVPEMLAREIGAIGYRIEADSLTLATAEPLADDELRLIGSYPRQLALLFPGVTS